MKDNFSIPILRNNKLVSSLSNSYGGSLRETRLTAILAYLISIKPEPFIKLFNINTTLVQLNIEYKEDSGRSDIQMITTNGIVIIEAKVDFVDPLIQARKYRAKWHVLLTNYSPLSREIHKNVIYINWQDIFNICVLLRSSKDFRIKFLATDIVNYLEEHGSVLSIVFALQKLNIRHSPFL